MTKFAARVVAGSVELSWYRNADNPDGAAREFTIHRRREDAFEFGKDYAEFFSGLGPQGAERVFSGPLSPANGVKYLWADKGAERGKTYAYYLETEGCPALGPAAVTVRDPETWWTHARMMAEIAALEAEFPGKIKAEIAGRGGSGRAIPALRLGTGPLKLALVGAIHAGEAGPELIVGVLRLLLEGGGPAATLLALPSVNVDSRERLAEGHPGYLRTTPTGVDLNRNFPADWGTVGHMYGLDTSDPDSETFRGHSPGSAPETRVVMDALAQFRPDAVFCHHALCGLCGPPLLAPMAGRDDQPFVARCRQLAEAFTAAFLPERPVSADCCYFGTDSGSLPTWVYREFGVPAFDLELGGELPDRTAIVGDKVTLVILEDYRRRYAAALCATFKQYP